MKGEQKVWLRRMDAITAGLVLAAGAAYYFMGPTGVLREKYGIPSGMWSCISGRDNEPIGINFVLGAVEPSARV